MPEQDNKLWRCSVCGYIHRGAEPPDSCPICGALKEAFEPYQEKARSAPKPKARTWRCMNCGYVHEGDEPPDVCPVCGAESDAFEPIGEAAEHVVGLDRAIRVVVLGAGIAGLATAEALREASPASEIVVISKEPELPYYRLNLTRFVAGEIEEKDLPIHPESWYEEQNIQLLRASEATSISVDDSHVDLRNGDRMPFDRLVLAIGAHPFMPPIPGAYREGVTPLRTVADARKILETVRDGARCVCIGGGLLGMETAGALAKQGGDVTLLEGHEWPMPRQLNRAAGERLARHVEEMKITLRTRARAEELVGDERVRAVALEDGTSVPADLVVVATGIRTNSYLARMAGLEVNNGVVVDNRLHSSHPSILAAGDVAEHRGTVYGIWGPSQFQGKIAGLNAAGVSTEFGGVPRSNTLKVLGLDLFSIGATTAEDGSYRTFEEEQDGAYFRFVFHDGHLAGAILLGDTSLMPAVKQAVEQRTEFGALLAGRPEVNDLLEFLGAQ